jgi:hypothetical protein
MLIEPSHSSSGERLSRGAVFEQVGRDIDPFPAATGQLLVELGPRRPPQEAGNQARHWFPDHHAEEIAAVVPAEQRLERAFDANKNK